MRNFVKLALAGTAILASISVSGPSFARKGADDPADHVRQCRGCDNVAGDVRRARGADDAAGDVRRSRGADDAAGDVRKSRGADDAPGDDRGRGRDRTSDSPSHG